MARLGWLEKREEEPFDKSKVLQDEAFLVYLAEQNRRGAALVPREEFEYRYAAFRGQQEKELVARREEIKRIKSELEKLHNHGNG